MSDLALQLPDELVDAIADRVADRLRAKGPEPWVGVREAAEHIGARPQRIYDLIHRKDESRIPHRREGSRLLFRLSDLDRWLEEGGGR